MPFRIGVCIGILLALGSANAQTTWYVDDANCPGPGSGTEVDPYCSIQVAHDAASPGDTVFVKSGTYFERLWITKSLEIAGEDRMRTKIDGGEGGDVVTLTGESIVLRGFTIQGSGIENLRGAAGVRATAGCRDITLTDNILTADYIGIVLEEAEQCTISSSYFKSNQLGITLAGCDGISVEDNLISRNSAQAIHLSGTTDSTFQLNVIETTGLLATEQSDGNLILDNVFNDCSLGVSLSSGSSNRIESNAFTNNGQGIGILGVSNQNTIEDNRIDGHRAIGISLAGETSLNTIDGNEVLSGGGGIILGGNGNIAANNTVANNDGNGIFLGDQSLQCEVRTNSLTGNDGGIHLDGAMNCTVVDNTLVNNGLWIEGDESDQFSTHVVSGNTLDGREVFYLSGGSDVAIPGTASQVILAACSNVTGDGLDLRGAEVGLVIAYCSNVTITDSIIANSDTGVCIQGSDQCSLVRSTVEDCKNHGVDIFGATNIELDANSILRNGADGVHGEQSDDLTLTANTVADGVRYGIHLLNECRRATVTDNECVRNLYGMYTIDDVFDFTIRDNSFSNNRNNGLHLKHAHDSLIDGNTIDSNGFYGMKLVDSQNNIVENNIITGNVGYYAIRAGDGSNQYIGNFVDGNLYGMLLGGNDLVVTGNTFSNNLEHGIDLFPEATGNLVSDNTITGNGKSGINLLGVDNTITGNTIADNRNHGILLSGTGTVISGNSIRGNARYGILADGSNNQIDGNTFERNRKFGVWLKAGSSMNRVHGNNFLPITKRGLVINRTARDDGDNRWDAGPQLGGGGNFWGDYTGKDDDGDGYGDVPYLIPGTGSDRGGWSRGQDRFPLMSPR